MSNQNYIKECDHSFPYLAPPTDFDNPVSFFCEICQSFFDAKPSPETKNAFIQRNETIFRALDFVDGVDEDEKSFLLGLQNQLYLTSEEQIHFDEIINPIFHLIYHDESEDN
jgi:hypothetical protein